MLEIYHALGQKIGCPEELWADLAYLVGPADTAYVLFCAGPEWVEPAALARAFAMNPESASELLEDLFRRGLVARRREGQASSGPVQYRAHDFYGLVQRQLGEGRVGGRGGPWDRLRQFYLTRRIAVTDGLIRRGELLVSSEVFPLEQAWAGHRHPHPGETRVVTGVDARRVLEDASAVQLLRCACRLTFRRCDKPLETCLILGSRAEEYRARGMGKPVEVEAATRILEVADREGLVHLAVYEPGDRPFALCACCPCCCHDLQALLQHGRSAWVRRSPWVARFHPEGCNSCGTCVSRCVFGALVWRDDMPVYHEHRCYGCGLCVTACPGEAITLVLRES